MDINSIFLLGILGSIIMIGFLGNILFSRTRIPESLFLIAAGLLIGPVLNLIDSETLLATSSTIATIALIVILLESGISLDIRKLLKNFSHATLYTLLVFILSTLLVTVFLHIIMQWQITHALILGIISGGTTTITVMTLLSRCAVTEDTKNLLFMESIINDITIISAIVIIIQVIEYSNLQAAKVANMILGSVSIAVVLGVLVGIFWITTIFKRLEKHPLNYVATLGIALMLYSFSEMVGANGAIAILLFSLTVGNFRNILMKLKIKKELITENSLETLKKIKSIQVGISFFVKTFFFFFLGVIFSFQNLTTEILLISFTIIYILLISRYFSTKILTFFDKKYDKESFLITTMLPRGLTATVVSFLPAEAGIEIPGLIEIVLLILLLSTMTAIAGSTIHQRQFPAEKNNNKKS